MRSFKFGMTSSVTVKEGCANIPSCDYNQPIKIHKIPDKDFDNTMTSIENYKRVIESLRTGALFKAFKTQEDGLRGMLKD